MEGGNPIDFIVNIKVVCPSDVGITETTGLSLAQPLIKVFDYEGVDSTSPF